MSIYKKMCLDIGIILYNCKTACRMALGISDESYGALMAPL